MTRAMRHPDIAIGRRTVSAYHVCGIAGLAAAALVTLVLAAYTGRSIPVMAGIIALGVLTFVALVVATTVIREERIINYHHEIAVVLVTALLVWRLGQPVLPYLDLTVVGLGAFVVCGRVGCFLVGCCHGRPHGWGVAYGEAHAAQGFPRHLVGVVLLPVQLLEAAGLAVVVAVDIVLLLGASQPGSVLAWHATAYAVGRFGVELVRGDTSRPYLAGLSEAQWTSLGVSGVVLLAGMAGWLPLVWWPLAANIALIAAALRLRAPAGSDRCLLRAGHVAELAELLEVAHERAAATGQVHIGRTSLGLRVSASTIPGTPHGLELFAFSSETGALDERAAGRIARLIGRLRRAGERGDLRPGDHGVYHVILPALTRSAEVSHAL